MRPISLSLLLKSTLLSVLMEPPVELLTISSIILYGMLRVQVVLPFVPLAGRIRKGSSKEGLLVVPSRPIALQSRLLSIVTFI